MADTNDDNPNNLTRRSRQRIEDATILVVEALPLMYFRKVHLPGAVNVPPQEVDRLAPLLLPDLDAAIALYCQDFSCPSSSEVATHLVELGYTGVVEYEAGKEDWIGAGLPTERGSEKQSQTAIDKALRDRNDWKVDVASDQSFPASDSPGYRP